MSVPVPSHGYSLRSRATPSPSTPTSTSTHSIPHSSPLASHFLSVPSTRPLPVSPTKRKLIETSSDEDEDEHHIGSDKLHEFHKVRISSRTDSDVREVTRLEQSKQLAQLQLEPPPSSTPPQQPPQQNNQQPQPTEQQHLQSPPLQVPSPSQQSAQPQLSQQATPTLTYAPSSWGYITSRGGRKENQDFYVVPNDEWIDAKNTNTAFMFGVFDGHGIKGLEAARDCGRCIHAHFSASYTAVQAQGARTQEWVDLTLHDAFKRAQETLLGVEAKSKQVLDYGTTACVAVIRPAQDELTIAWAGDARAAMVRWETVVSTPRISIEDVDSSSASGGSSLGEKATTFIYNSGSNNSINSPSNNNNNTTSMGEILRTGSKGDDGGCSPFLNCESAPGSPESSTTTVDDSGSVQPNLQVLELTSDHVPQREDERARVLQQGGVIRRVGNVVRVVAGGNFTEEQLKQQRLALNITRSLGHAILSQYGISSEPDVLRTTIQTDDILLIASDGLWNELTSSEISAIALECKMAGFSPQKFCNMLLRRAEVVSKLKGVLSDNITIVVYHHTPV